MNPMSTTGPERPDQAEGPGHLLEACDVHKAYGRTEALRGLSAAIGPGEVVAITGASGSGKSTLLHCLAGIITPDSGEIRFDGIRLDRQDEHTRTRLRRENLGIVFQFGGLVPELTAVENVALPLMLSGQDRTSATAAATEWLARLDINGCAGSRPGELSGGEAQRVAIARALVTDPRVVFADEPTGALDSVTGEQVLGLLVRSARERGTTVVIVTHDNRIAAYADREIVLRDGRTSSFAGFTGFTRGAGGAGLSAVASTAPAGSTTVTDLEAP